jgi:hypothetical protein
VRDRAPPDQPADRDRGGLRRPAAPRTRAGAALPSVERFESPRAEQRFARLAQWDHGGGWGALVLLPSHDIVPPIVLRGCGEIAAKLWHNLPYAVATGAAFDALAEDR